MYARSEYEAYQSLNRRDLDYQPLAAAPYLKRKRSIHRLACIHGSFPRTKEWRVRASATLGLGQD